MFLLKKGTVAIRKRRNSAYVEIARIYSNEVLGELSFFDRQPRSAAAVALTECEALEIDFGSLDKIWQGVPDYMKTIMAAVAERLRKANDQIRRLQKEVIVEQTAEQPAADDMADAAAVLAATSGIGTTADAGNGTATDAESGAAPESGGEADPLAAIPDLPSEGEGDDHKS